MTAINMSTASRQWASRPDDERYTSLLDMHAYFVAQRQRSAGKVVSTHAVELRPSQSDEIRGVELFGPAGQGFAPTHTAFNHLAQRAGAPAGYLRTLPAPIACDAINYGLRFNGTADDVGLLVERDEDARTLRAVTGPRYGRVWNHEVTRALTNRFGDGVTGDWRVPGEFGKAVDVTKANTTLYASDRDMFVFLADETNKIEVPNRRDGKTGLMSRGFFVWNSETGDGTLGVAGFTFDYVCQNRNVWGMEGLETTKIRHTVSAPERFVEEVAPVIAALRHSSAAPMLAMIEAAQERKVDDLAEFLKTRRFAAGMTAKLQAVHEAEEGRPVETLFDVNTAITAYARGVEHQDERVALEREAGRLMKLAA